MSDVETNLRTASSLGVYATQVLENPAFKAVFERMRAEIVEAWSASSVLDTGKQQLLLQQIKLVDRVQSHLVSMIGAGDAADKLGKPKVEIDTADLHTEGRVARFMRTKGMIS